MVFILPVVRSEPCDHLHDVLRRCDRAFEAAQFVQLGVIGLHIAEQRLDRHRRRDLGLLEEALHIIDVQRRHGRQQVRAVDRRQPVTGLQTGDRDARPLHRLVTRAAVRLHKKASPSPISSSAACAMGARSPLAPTEPF